MLGISKKLPVDLQDTDNITIQQYMRKYQNIPSSLYSVEPR